MSKNKLARMAAGAALVWIAFFTQAFAVSSASLDHPAFAAIAGLTSIPVGHAEFCHSHAGECGPNALVVDTVELTEARWGELLEVNASINGTVVPVTDQDLYQVAEFWTFPHGYGDCEDFVLAKQRELINRGWPASTLLISVVTEANGDGHAVLMVRTDRGDLILDNQDGYIRLWNETPYHFIKRQSQANAGQWVDIVDTRPAAGLASR